MTLKEAVEYIYGLEIEDLLDETFLPLEIWKLKRNGELVGFAVDRNLVSAAKACASCAWSDYEGTIYWDKEIEDA